MVFLDLSVVVPCYNEQDVLRQLYARVTAVCQGLHVDYELVLVDDGSTDTTGQIITEMTTSDPAVVGVRLSRNHGHQLALSAGLSVCRGERILMLDADLQDPPELLPEMVEQMDLGADIVYGQRVVRRGESIFRRMSYYLFYRFLRLLSDTDIPLDAGDFRLISRRVLDIVLAMPERHRFLRGMISWTGFRQTPVPYDRDPRFAGTTKYPLGKLFRLAIDGVTSFSVKPLAIASLAGGTTALFAMALLAYSIAGWIFFENIPPGWVSLMGGMAVLATIHFLVLGIIGEYLGRIYEQGQGRPLFIIEEIVRSSNTPEQLEDPTKFEDSALVDSMRR